MDSMLERYEEMRDRVEATRRTLAATSERVERQNQLKTCIDNLKERAMRIEATKRALDRASTSLGKSGARVDYAQMVQRLQIKLANKKQSKKVEQQMEKVKKVFI